MCFVLDDAPWKLELVDLDTAVEALESLAERLDETRNRKEEVLCYSGIYQECRVTGNLCLYELLFDENSPLAGKDVLKRLIRHLDRIASLQDCHLPALDVMVQEEVLFAPSVAWAHAKLLNGEPTGCLTLRTTGRRGVLPVAVEDRMAQVHFVTDENTHVTFFRKLITDSADERTMERFAPSAFPHLCFVHGVWKGLKDFSRPYKDIRRELVEHLSVFSDHGASEFSKNQNQLVEQGFFAHRINISPENHETLNDRRCREARERVFGGEKLVFEWHAKIEKHQDRIHVHPGTRKSDNRIIIGIFHQHLPLPGD